MYCVRHVHINKHDLAFIWCDQIAHLANHLYNSALEIFRLRCVRVYTPAHTKKLHDLYGQVSKIQGNRTETVQHDADDNVLSRIMATYDANGDMLSQTRWDGTDDAGNLNLSSTYEFEYDSDGIQTKQTAADGDGKQTSCIVIAGEYDSLGREVSETGKDCDTGEIMYTDAYTYDSKDRVTVTEYYSTGYESYSDGQESTEKTTSTYDDNDCMTSEIHEKTDSSGELKPYSLSVMSYDDQGHQTHKERYYYLDDSGNQFDTPKMTYSSSYECDEHGLVIKETDELNSTYTEYEYDQVQNCTKMADYNMDGTLQLCTDYTYTQLG